jgi:hypothetical protein
LQFDASVRCIQLIRTKSNPQELLIKIKIKKSSRIISRTESLEPRVGVAVTSDLNRGEQNPTLPAKPARPNPPQPEKFGFLGFNCGFGLFFCKSARVGFGLRVGFLKIAGTRPDPRFVIYYKYFFTSKKSKDIKKRAQ